MSDDEEGDYDNVLGYLEARKPPSRSHQNSYANLQKLRQESNGEVMLPSDGGETSLEDGLHLRRRNGYTEAKT